MSDFLTIRDVSKMIDHALLHPTMTDAEIAAGCRLAKTFNVATACIKPYSIGLARDVLAGSDVLACAVIGFPHGNSTTAIKVREAQAAVADGAPEIDMVVNIGKAIGGDWGYVAAEIKAINDTAVASGGLLKVIFENDFLGDGQIIKLCEICSEIGVAFVKTSTGFGFVKQPSGQYASSGATIEQLKLMRSHTAPSVQIKAAGGIRSLDQLLMVRSLGVTRVGASATQAILEEAQRRAAAGTLTEYSGIPTALGASAY